VPQLSLYPNPAEEYIHLKTDSPILETRLLDAMGREVQYIVLEKDKLSVSSLKPGFYWVKIKTSKGIATQKFVKR